MAPKAPKKAPAMPKATRSMSNPPSTPKPKGGTQAASARTPAQVVTVFRQRLIAKLGSDEAACAALDFQGKGRLTLDDLRESLQRMGVSEKAATGGQDLKWLFKMLDPQGVGHLKVKALMRGETERKATSTEKAPEAPPSSRPSSPDSPKAPKAKPAGEKVRFVDQSEAVPEEREAVADETDASKKSRGQDSKSLADNIDDDETLRADLDSMSVAPVLSKNTWVQRIADLGDNWEMRSLDLRWAHMGAEGAERIAAALERGHERAKAASQAATATAIFAGAVSNKPTLDLKSKAGKMSRMGGRGSSVGMAAKSKSPTRGRNVAAPVVFEPADPSLHCLETMRLCGNYFGSPGVVALANAIEKFCALKLLALSWNAVDDNGASRLALTLLAMRSLVELDLSHNRIADEGANKLARAIGMRPPALKKVDLQHNSVGILGKIALEKSCQKRVKVNLDTNMPIPPGTAQSALADAHAKQKAAGGPPEPPHGRASPKELMRRGPKVQREKAGRHPKQSTLVLEDPSDPPAPVEEEEKEIVAGLRPSPDLHLNRLVWAPDVGHPIKTSKPAWEAGQAAEWVAYFRARDDPPPMAFSSRRGSTMSFGGHSRRASTAPAGDHAAAAAAATAAHAAAQAAGALAQSHSAPSLSLSPTAAGAPDAGAGGPRFGRRPSMAVGAVAPGAQPPGATQRPASTGPVLQRKSSLAPDDGLGGVGRRGAGASSLGAIREGGRTPQRGGAQQPVTPNLRLPAPGGGLERDRGRGGGLSSPALTPPTSASRAPSSGSSSEKRTYFDVKQQVGGDHWPPGRELDRALNHARALGQGKVRRPRSQGATTSTRARVNMPWAGDV